MSPKHKDDNASPLGFLSRLRKAFTNYLFAGLTVWVPLIVSLWVTWFVIQNFVLVIEAALQGLVVLMKNAGARYEWLGFLQHIQYQFGFGIAIALVIFLSTGLIARFIIGQRIIAFADWLVHQVPFINRVYRAVQQIRDTFVNRQGAMFQNTCLVEYPRPGVYAVAFVTSTEYGLVQNALEKDLVAVFMPSTPNPTTGFLMYMPPDQVTIIDITTEEALKLIVSAGAYIPGEGPPIDELMAPGGEQPSAAFAGGRRGSGEPGSEEAAAGGGVQPNQLAGADAQAHERQPSVRAARPVQDEDDA